MLAYNWPNVCGFSSSVLTLSWFCQLVAVLCPQCQSSSNDWTFCEISKNGIVKLVIRFVTFEIMSMKSVNCHLKLTFCTPQFECNRARDWFQANIAPGFVAPIHSPPSSWRTCWFVGRGILWVEQNLEWCTLSPNLFSSFRFISIETHRLLEEEQLSDCSEYAIHANEPTLQFHVGVPPIDCHEVPTK